MSNYPRHGKWCNTRTRKTACFECKQAVFYFSCDCGSSVLFDDRDAWQKHDCDRRWQKSLKRTFSTDGCVETQITSGITAYRNYTDRKSTIRLQHSIDLSEFLKQRQRS